MRPSTAILIAPAAALLVAAPTPAGDEAAKVFTNEDLKKEAPPGKEAVTNEDLAAAEGNLSFTEPGDDTSYEGTLPRETKTKKDLADEAALKALKTRYQKLRVREEEIEEELPKAREDASRELGPGVVLINGVPTSVGPASNLYTPAHYHLEQLEKELREVRKELGQIESEARQMGLGRPALMQR